MTKVILIMISFCFIERWILSWPCYLSLFGIFILFLILSLLNLRPLRFYVFLHVISGQFYCQIHIFSILLRNPSENSCYPVFSEQTIETHILPSSKPPILNKQFGNISISFAIKTCISTWSHPSRVLKVPNKSIWMWIVLPFREISITVCSTT